MAVDIVQMLKGELMDLIERHLAERRIDEALSKVFTNNSGSIGKQILDKIPSAQPEQKWIPCKTGILPEERDKFYQATYLLDNGDRIVDYVYFNSKGMWSNYAYEYSELLAWMPLPEPYREDGGK